MTYSALAPVTGRRDLLAGPGFLLFALCALLSPALPACERSTEQGASVTLYTSVDEPFAREVVAAFEKQTGIRVQLKTDTEAGKTTQLVQRLEAERSNPQADVFWSSEVFNTIRMANAGLFEEYRPPAEGIPDRYRQAYWTGFGLRARVLCYNTDKLKPEELPADWTGLADPRWKGRLGVADPRFGTTGGHFAALYVTLGEGPYVEFLQRLHATLGGRLLDGNATVSRLVGSGELLLGMTDTDDVHARQAAKEPIAMTYPALGTGGTLLIPNTVALIRNAPHPEAGRKLIDFLASDETERMLARSESRNIPVRESLRRELDMALPPGAEVDYAAVAEAFPKALELAGRHLVR